MIDILIPTYNRKLDLIKNIYHLYALIKKEHLDGHFNVLVSDNCSPDNTASELTKLAKKINLKITIFRQKQNIGLEKNAIFLLKEAVSDYIMFIGDDDYLPDGYLSYMIDKLEKEPLTTAIVPGMSNLYEDGSIIPDRFADFDETEYLPSFKTAYRISYFGHQLSGILTKREGMLEEYLKNKNLRNIYPWIFFLAYNNLRGKSYYAPKFKVLISQGNSKDWRYDDSGLLTEIFKNYKILHPNSSIKRLLLCQSIMTKQAWRLRIDRNPKLAVMAFLHLMRSDHVDKIVKFSLFFLYPYFYLRLILSKIKKKIL